MVPDHVIADEIKTIRKVKKRKEERKEGTKLKYCYENVPLSLCRKKKNYFHFAKEAKRICFLVRNGDLLAQAFFYSAKHSHTHT